MHSELWGHWDLALILDDHLFVIIKCTDFTFQYAAIVHHKALTQDIRLLLSTEALQVIWWIYWAITIGIQTRRRMICVHLIQLQFANLARRIAYLFGALFLIIGS